MAFIPRFPVSAFAVGPITKAEYQTIQSAINAANSIGGGQVFIQPGSYAENLTLYDNVSLVGAQGTPEDVVITGVITPPLSGDIAVTNVTLVSASDIFFSAGAGTTNIALNNVVTQAASGYTFDLAAWEGFLSCERVSFEGAADGVINNAGDSAFFLGECIGGSSGSTMATIANGTFRSTTLGCAWTPTAGIIQAFDSEFRGTVTLSGIASGRFIRCRFATGATQAITQSSASAVELIGCSINSSNNPAIGGAGAGALKLIDVAFESNAIIAGTVTTSSGSGMILGDFGTATHVLTSNGAGVAPSWQVVSSSGAVMDIDGNSGTATPTAGTITITTGAANAQGTAVFTASGSTVTQTFNDVNNNLGLGANSLNSMSAGFAVQNTGIGTNTLTAVTTGDNNVAIGYNALQALTVGNWSTAVGSEALQAYDNSLANDAFGWRSLRFATTGQQNCAFGSSALSDITTGSGNVAIGNQSGGALQTNSSSNICINHTGVLLDQNTLRIGQATGSGSRELNRAFICGIDGISTDAASNVILIDSGNKLGTTAGGTVTLNTGTQTLNVSTDASATTVNIATGAAAKTVTLGSTNTTSSLALRYGTGDFTLASATGNVMVVQDTGEITYPLQPAFMAFASGNLTNVTGDATVYKIAWNSESFDRSNDFSTATNQFTAPVSGLYYFACFLQSIGITASHTQQYIYMNTSNNIFYQYTNSPAAFRTASNNNSAFNWILAFMDAGDVCYTEFRVDGGTKVASIQGTINYSGFYGWLVS